MPSPPLAPDDGPIDLEHLQRMTLGDSLLEREVLAMFISQCDRLMRRLKARPTEAAALAHTLKGSARAIGAMRVAACAAALELAIRRREDLGATLRELSETVAEARTAIAALLERPEAH